MSDKTALPKVVEINTPEQLEELRLIWTLLASQTRGASLFHTLDWLQAYWKHFGADQKLRVLVVSSGDTPIGILPLTVVREKTRVGTIRVFTYPLPRLGHLLRTDWSQSNGYVDVGPAAHSRHAA